MTGASKNHHYYHHQASSSKPPRNPNHTSTINITQANPPNPNSTTITTTTISPLTLSKQDEILSRATHITVQELLKRRSHKLKQLSKCYRNHYWALMEELKIQYRQYYWKYGVSPFKEDQYQPQQEQQQQGQIVKRESGEREGNIEVIGENNNTNNMYNNVGFSQKGCGSGGGGGGVDLDLKNNRQCLFVGCKLRAMALTSFCHLHILSDAKQKLYKPCSYVIKSAQAGPITCGKPIMRSTTPSLCAVHFQKAQKHVTRALKQAGFSVSSSSKLAPKFHVIVAEYVHQIQAKRRSAKSGNRSKAMDKEANTS